MGVKKHKGDEVKTYKHSDLRKGVKYICIEDGEQYMNGKTIVIAGKDLKHVHRSYWESNEEKKDDTFRLDIGYYRARLRSIEADRQSIEALLAELE